MKTNALEIPVEPRPVNGNVFTFPYGLPGFPNLKKWELLYDPGELPFLWLQTTEGSDIGFVVLEPWGAIPRYEIEISTEDCRVLDAKCPSDLFVINIVSVHSASPRKVTVNLVAPIAINRHTNIGKQVILENHHQLSTRHVLVDETQANGGEG